MYYIVLIVISILYLLADKRNRAKSDTFLFSAFIVLLLVSSIRGYNVGGDLSNYIPLFREISNSTFESIFQSYTKYGYIFTCYIKAASLISSDPTFLLFATSLINLAPVFFFIRAHSNNYWISLMIYICMAYYTNTFNSIRSSMALAIGLLAVHYLLENKNFRYFLLCLVAIEIHKTIFPILFIGILKKITPTWTVLITAIGGSVILSNMINIDFFFNAIALYSEDYAQMEASGAGYTMLLMDIILTFGIFYLLRGRLTTERSTLINILCMATCIQAFAPVFSLMTRIALFFTVQIIILLPMAIETAFTPASKVLVKSLMICICLLYFHMFVMSRNMIYEDGVRSNSQRTIPYSFYWQTTSV